jgi:hypothetical protein
MEGGERHRRRFVNENEINHHVNKYFSKHLLFIRIELKSLFAKAYENTREIVSESESMTIKDFLVHYLEHFLRDSFTSALCMQ